MYPRSIARVASTPIAPSEVRFRLELEHAGNVAAGREQLEPDSASVRLATNAAKLVQKKSHTAKGDWGRVAAQKSGQTPLSARPIGAIPDLEAALYFSVVTFTTLGYGDMTLETDWRLLASFEAASGIIMFGWSTALVVAYIQRLAPVRHGHHDASDGSR